MRSATMEWEASANSRLFRKRLELVPSAALLRSTSVIRYARNSVFPVHAHLGGQEILVLEGAFADEHGDYQMGTFLLNPQKFCHTPVSNEGCVLFVKEGQYSGATRIHTDSAHAEWVEEGDPGRHVIELFAGGTENIRLTRLDKGTHIPIHEHFGGNEMFILQGTIEDEYGCYGVGDWIRSPAGSVHNPWTDEGCILYVKDGHLFG